ncbi:MAG: pyridoxamine kinase [Ileibacterium sp.]|nr:pyridoxamine kinase [Ileibacterium sp.]
MRSKQKTIALINDLSGFGRCSLTVSLPILSALQVQCAVLPTCILSNHTAYPSYLFHDLTDDMSPWMEEWKKLDLSFNGIYTGFLGSEDQIQKVKDFCTMFQTSQTCMIVDPVMGDHGKIYPTYTEGMCEKMKELARMADVLTPNLTEACRLLDRPFRNDYSKEDLERIIRDLLDLGPQKAVISGLEMDDEVFNLAIERGKEPCWIPTKKVLPFRHGTGDVFASVIAGDAVKGLGFYESVQKAADFVHDCLLISNQLEVPMEDGVAFEEILGNLITKN